MKRIGLKKGEGTHLVAVHNSELSVELARGGSLKV